MNKAPCFILSFFLALLVLVSCAQAQETITVKVAGYPAKGYSISPAMSQQLITQVVTPIQSAYQHSPNSEISISIAGYADKSGTTDGNDNWSELRAQAIYNFLVTRVPKQVTFGAYPMGSSSLDERAAILTITIGPAIPAPLLKTSSTVHVVGGIVLAILAVIFLIFKKRSNERLTPLTLKTTATVHEWPKVVIVKVVEVERDGRTLFIPIEKREDRYFTPLPYPNGVRDNITDATKAAKNGIKDPNYKVSDTELQALIAKGSIWLNRHGPAKGEVA